MRPPFDFVEFHSPKPIALARATSIVGMGRTHFTGSFKKVTAQFFDAYLNHFRIFNAQAFLAFSDLPIFTISFAVEFCDQSYFGFVFHSRMHVALPRMRKKTFPALNVDC